MANADLREILRHGKRIVFFGGAGTSTESGIPDFRSATGLYRTASGMEYSPETMLSHSFFMRHLEEFYTFYRTKMIYRDAQPNAAHIALAELEKSGRLQAVVTQNIDGLHQAAGSSQVLELHGSVHRNFCMACGAFYPLAKVLESPDPVPKCDKCGGTVKPDVVLYEESLDSGVLERSLAAIGQADVLLVGGTSLTVNPAAGLVRYFRGDRLVLINKSATAYDNAADLVIRESIGKTLKEAMEDMA
jgi:NAD-dependent deacetylase